MNIRKFNSNRLTDLLEDGVGRVQDVAGDLQKRVRKDSRRLAKEARHRYADGREKLVDAEEALVQSVRENPAMFAGVLLLLVALFVGGMLMRNPRRQDLAQDEW